MSIPSKARQRTSRAKTYGAAFAWIMLLAFCAFSPTAVRATLIWDSDYGAALPDSSFSPSGNDGLLSESLSFSVPFQGNTYNSVTISTSGFVWLGPTNGAQCCVIDNESDALTYFNGSPPRVAPAWYDLRPDLGGTIYFNDVLNGDGTRVALITFVDVPSDTNDSDLATFQMQLYSTGTIIFSYLTFDSTSLGPDPAALAGLTLGEGSTATAVDLTNVLAGNSATTSAPGVYDYLQDTDNFDLSNQSVAFLPQNGGGWEVETAQTPEPATLLSAALALLLFAARFNKRRIVKY